MMLFHVDSYILLIVPSPLLIIGVNNTETFFSIGCHNMNDIVSIRSKVVIVDSKKSIPSFLALGAGLAYAQTI